MILWCVTYILLNSFPAHQYAMHVYRRGKHAWNHFGIIVWSYRKSHKNHARLIQYLVRCVFSLWMCIRQLALFIHIEFPGSPTVTIESGDANNLTVIWSPPATCTAGVPTVYKITINDSSASTLTVPETGSSRYAHTFNNLTSNEHYTVSVSATNCAGTTVSTADGYSGILDAWKTPNLSRFTVYFISGVEHC